MPCPAPLWSRVCIRSAVHTLSVGRVGCRSSPPFDISLFRSRVFGIPFWYVCHKVGAERKEEKNNLSKLSASVFFLPFFRATFDKHTKRYIKAVERKSEMEKRRSRPSFIRLFPVAPPHPIKKARGVGLVGHVAFFMGWGVRVACFLVGGWGVLAPPIFIFLS